MSASKPKPRAKAKPKPKARAKPKAKSAAAAAAEAKRRERAEYPPGLHPPDRVKAQWTRRGRAICERGYSQRWAAFWKRTVLALKEQETWRDHDIHLVGEYVKRCRLVELHGEEAELDPYVTNEDTGVVRAHPGWERALAESREARMIAVELKLTPRARQDAGIEVPDVSGAGPDGVKFVDDQVDEHGRL
jgi:hypothetical protein